MRPGWALDQDEIRDMTPQIPRNGGLHQERLGHDPPHPRREIGQ
jgi:hypothetical protein